MKPAWLISSLRGASSGQEAPSLTSDSWMTFQPILCPTSGMTSAEIQSQGDPKIYVVQTAATAIERCILMTTDPGDLVLEPHLRLRHHSFSRRTMGPPMDHYRHQPRRPRACPHPPHGR